MLAAVPFVLSLQNQLSSLAAQRSSEDIEMKSVRLSFAPYSSSYLVSSEGAIVATGIDRPFPHLGFFKKEIVQDFEKKESTIHKFDRIREQEFGKKDPIEPQIQKTHVKPGAPAWEGFCHQWSAAAANPEVSEMLSKSEGSVCRDIILTKGELKELFTALYTLPNQSKVWGERQYRPMTEDQYNIRMVTGLDDLPAHHFYLVIYDYLARDIPVVMDRDYDVQVWNHIISAAESGIRKVKLQDLLSDINFVPMSALKGSSATVQRSLDTIAKVDKLLLEALGRNLTTEELAQAISDLKKEFPQISSSPEITLPSLMKTREALVDEWVKPRILAGEITQGDNITLQIVQTKVTLAWGHKQYARNEEEPGKDVFYDYLMVRKDGDLIDSRWTNLPYQRPDFIWSPEQVDLKTLDPSKDKHIYRAELKDLYTITQKCTNISEIVRFFSFLDEVTKKGWLGPIEKIQLRRAYQKVEPFINQELVNQKLIDAKIPDFTGRNLIP